MNEFNLRFTYMQVSRTPPPFSGENETLSFKHQLYLGGPNQLIAPRSIAGYYSCVDTLPDCVLGGILCSPYVTVYLN